jgi:hypothetical protein
MSDYAIPCTIFIKPQEGHSLPENFREQFVDEAGDFTYEKTRPTEPFDDHLEGHDVSDGTDNTLTIQLETGRPPYAWLDHLGAAYPDLFIELEHNQIESDPEFGRIVWFEGGRIYDREVTGMSVERYAYFGWYVDEDEDEDTRSWYPEFQDEKKGATVKALKDAVASSDWIALMDALFTARQELDDWEDPDMPEDALRLAIVTTDASLDLLRAVLTDDTVDVDPIAAEIGCECDVEEGEPIPVGTIDDLIPFLEEMAVLSAGLVSLSHRHYAEKAVLSLKESVQEVDRKTKIHLTEVEDKVFALLPDIDEDSYVDDLVALFENAPEPVHPELLRIVANRVGYFLDGGGEPDEDEHGYISGEKSRRIVNAAKEMAEEGESDRDALFSAIARLQGEWFWGDMNIDAGSVNYIQEHISRIENGVAESHVREFVYWNILEPWEEFVGDGEFPDDQDYMESFKEWKQAVEAFLGANLVQEPVPIG